VWLAGRKLELRNNQKSKITVEILKQGTYFLYPPDALKGRTLQIDGQPLTTDELTLSAGTHEVQNDGRSGEVFLLWLPRNGQRWAPSPGPARFSRME
jgi:hypothetical protein